VVLYGSPSTASLVVHWLLVELGIEHELHQLDFDRREQKSPEYLALNPAGRVPTLVIDGQVLTESAAIAMHLPTCIRRLGSRRLLVPRRVATTTAGCASACTR